MHAVFLINKLRIVNHLFLSIVQIMGSKMKKPVTHVSRNNTVKAIIN